MEEAPRGSPRALGLCLFAVVVVAIASWFAWSDEGALPSPPSDVGDVEATTNAPSPANDARVVEPQHADEIAATKPVESERTRAAPRTAGPDEFLVRGRCVGEDGLPLADCAAVLIRMPAQTEAWLVWRRENPTAELPAPVLVTTSADGRFEVAGVAAPAFAVVLRVVRSDLVPAHATLGSPGRAARIDIGDFVLHRGVKIVGRVTSEDGAPCADRRVTLQDQDTTRMPRSGSTTPTPHVWVETRTKEDGSFEFADLVREGTWHLDATAAGPHALPFRVEASLARPVETVNVVVAAPLSALAIEGRVVDDNGLPIADARVSVRTEGTNAVPREVRTDQDGAFAVIPFRGEERFAVVVRSGKLGLGIAEARSEVAWGTRGLVLTIPSPPAVELRLIDERSEPVVAFTAWIHLGSQSMASASLVTPSPTIPAPGPYPDGVVRFTGCAEGRLRALLEFPAASGLPPRHVDLVAGAKGTTRTEVKVDRGVALTVRLVDGTGGPIAGAPVSICELRGKRFDRNTDLGDLRDGSTSPSTEAPLVLVRATTDADGSVRTRVPTGTRLGIAAPGPMHVPMYLDLGSLAVDTERDLAVQRGATLRGRLLPAEAIADLRKRAGVGPFDSWNEHARPQVLLVPLDGPVDESPLAFQKWTSIRVAEDGRFELRGIPSGAYEVRLRIHAPNAGASSQPFRPTLGRVQLVEAIETEVEYEIDPHRHVRCALRAVSNGAPIANAFVTVLCTPNLTARSNEAGIVVVEAEPGLYDLRLTKVEKEQTVVLRAATPVSIRANSIETPVDVPFPAARVRLRVVDADGNPMPAVDVRARCEEVPEILTGMPPSDAEGRVTAWILCGTHALEASVRPEPDKRDLARARQMVVSPPLVDPVAAKAAVEQSVLRMARNLAAERTVWHALGMHAFLVADPGELELRLPPR